MAVGLSLTLLSDLLSKPFTSSGEILLMLQGDYKPPLKAGIKHMYVQRYTHSFLVTMQDLGVERQHSSASRLVSRHSNREF